MLTQVDRKCVAQVVEWLELFLKPKLLSGKLQFSECHGCCVIYDDTKFTPCNCNLNKDERPLWHFSARKTRINKITNTVYHDGVTLHILDLPILYTPTFAHPDWTVERRTGFLTPSISVGKETGLTVKQPYYINKSKSDDFTFTPIIYSKSGFLGDLEYRKVTNNSNLKANFICGQVDTFNKNNEDVISGFVSYNSINENNWKTKVILQDSSEDSFLRKYKLTEETILKSSLSTQKLLSLIHISEPTRPY